MAAYLNIYVIAVRKSLKICHPEKVLVKLGIYRRQRGEAKIVESRWEVSRDVGE